PAAVPFEREHLLAPVQVPYPYRLVVPCEGQPGSVLTEGYAQSSNIAGISPDSAKFVTVPDIPDFYGRVPAGRTKASTVHSTDQGGATPPPRLGTGVPDDGA